MEAAKDFSSLAQGSNPHCFEIITDTMVYYVGESGSGQYHNPALAASGVGPDVAQGWERAIRQALMPVTPQPSVCTTAGQGKDHSEYPVELGIWGWGGGCQPHASLAALLLSSASPPTLEKRAVSVPQSPPSPRSIPGGRVLKSEVTGAVRQNDGFAGARRGEAGRPGCPFCVRRLFGSHV